MVDAVEAYVREELRDAAKYDNSTPLDESGVWSLHALAAHIYALGFEAGERAEDRKSRARAERAESKRTLSP